MSKLGFFNKNKIKRRFILLATIILLGIGWYGISVLRPWDIQINIPGGGRKLPDYVFQDIVLTAVSGPQIFYRVSANSFTLDRAQGLLDRVTGSILEKNGLPVLDFTAQSGVLNVNRQSVVFKVFAGHTFSAQLWRTTAAEAIWDSRRQDFTLTGQPRIFSADTLVVADRMVYNVPLNSFTIDQGCEVTKGEYILQGGRAVLQNQILTMDKNISLNNSEFALQSEALKYDMLKDELVFQNNVILRTDEILLTGDQILLDSAQEKVYLQGNVRFSSSSENMLVNTDRAIWDRQAKQIEFFENTRAWKNDSLLESDQLIYDFGRNDLRAEGGGRTRLIRSADE